jgi:hypothetical protein
MESNASEIRGTNVVGEEHEKVNEMLKIDHPNNPKRRVSFA